MIALPYLTIYGRNRPDIEQLLEIDDLWMKLSLELTEKSAKVAHELVQDLRRFVLYDGSAIEKFPPSPTHQLFLSSA